MSDAGCAPPPLPPVLPPGTGAGLAPDDGSRLVRLPTELMATTSRRETDSHTAVRRGLKEYLEQQVIDLWGGHQFRFARVFDDWAQHEDRAVYPAAYIYSANAGSYDASSFTPVYNQACRLADGSYLLTYAEQVVLLDLECWCTDPEERIGAAMLVEDALTAVDWRYGVRVELPHYFNLRADYALMTAQFIDTEDQAVQRQRVLKYQIEARVPLVRRILPAGTGLPGQAVPADAMVSAEVTVEVETDVDC